jgi:Abortive infection C-terminus
LEGRVKVSLNWPLRNRLWDTMHQYNESYDETVEGWHQTRTLLDDTQRDLIRLLGLGQLTISIGDKHKETDLETYFKKSYPSNVLDVLEQFYLVVGNPPGSRERAWNFQREVNDAMADFESPWRLSDGLFFKIDSEFLDRENIQKTEDQLRRQGFSGALDEFRAARDDLSGAEFKDAILKAAQSVESVLKTVTGNSSGDMGKLTELFQKRDFLDDIPADKQKALAKPIFQGLAVLRNELSGHGQGEEKIKVDRPYAALAVHFAGALTQFVIDQYLRKQPFPAVEEAQPSTEEQFDEEPDDIPF